MELNTEKYEIYEQVPLTLKKLSALPFEDYAIYSEAFFGGIQTLDKKHCVEAKIYQDAHGEFVVFLDYLYLADEKNMYYELDPGEDDFLRFGFTYEELIAKMLEILADRLEIKE